MPKMSWDEIRAEAWRLLWGGYWFWKVLAVALIFHMLGQTVGGFLQGGFTAYFFITCQMRLADAMSGGGPESLAGMFSDPAMFVQLAVYGVLTAAVSLVVGSFGEYARRATLLRAAEGRRDGWLEGAFGGLKRPFDTSALNLLQTLLVTLGTLLFVVPGLVAVYRYQMAWYLKCDHPDWSAWKCLGESARMMDGRKAQAFALDCSYWRIFTVMMMPALFGSLVLLFGSLNGFDERIIPAVAAFLIGAVTTGIGCALAGVYLSLGTAILYREMRREG